MNKIFSNTLHYFLFLIVLSPYTGCSKYITYLEKSQNPDIILKEEVSPPLFCQRKTKQPHIIHDSQFTFSEFSKILEDKHIIQKDIISQGIFLLLYQSLVRPESTDINSSIQIHAKLGDKEFHRGLNLKDSPFPFLKALLLLKDHYKLPFSISSLISLADRVFPQKLTIQESFMKYLKDKKDFLIKDHSIKKFFFKLNNPLQKGESFPRQSFSHFYKNLKKVIPLNSHLLLAQRFNEEDPYLCNFSTYNYHKGLFNLENTESLNENAFALIGSFGDYFYAVTRKKEADKAAYKGQLFPGTTPKSKLPFCLYKDKNKSFVMTSFSSRDPGQLLYHLINYKIHEAENPQDAYNYLNYPRHQFLTHPSRILYESQKGTEAQLRYFLSFDFPVYHVRDLGIVNVLWQNEKSLVFLPDSRSRLKKSCHQK